MSKQSDLDAIASEITEKNICPELARSATQLVPGAGDANAEIMFIGEAPGRDEDLKGEPFVGAAGKFLNQMLDSIGLERGKVFITNIVKYRPPNNRDPLPGEVASFMPFLFRQIAIIKPKLLVTLGRHAMNVFMPEARISVVHGQPKRQTFVFSKERRSTQVILPLYHPAAALYNGDMRATLSEDFARIPRILELINNNKEKSIKGQKGPSTIAV